MSRGILIYAIIPCLWLHVSNYLRSQVYLLLELDTSPIFFEPKSWVILWSPIVQLKPARIPMMSDFKVSWESEITDNPCLNELIIKITGWFSWQSVRIADYIQGIDLLSSFFRQNNLRIISVFFDNLGHPSLLWFNLM